MDCSEGLQVTKFYYRVSEAFKRFKTVNTVEDCKCASNIVHTYSNPPVITLGEPEYSPLIFFSEFTNVFMIGGQNVYGEKTYTGQMV